MGRASWMDNRATPDLNECHCDEYSLDTLTWGERITKTYLAYNHLLSVIFKHASPGLRTFYGVSTAWLRHYTCNETTEHGITYFHNWKKTVLTGIDHSTPLSKNFTPRCYINTLNKANLGGTQPFGIRKRNFWGKPRLSLVWFTNWTDLTW